MIRTALAIIALIICAVSPGYAQQPAAAPKKPAPPIFRMADGKPNFQGHFQADAGGANWGLEIGRAHV